MDNLAKFVKSVFTRKQYPSSQMAPYSPDINPIGNVWGIKKQLALIPPKTPDEIAQKVRHIWFMPLVILVDFKKWLHYMATDF